MSVAIVASHAACLAAGIAIGIAFWRWDKQRNSALGYDLVALVRKYATEIDNGRTTQDIYDHLQSEIKELDVDWKAGHGADGVVGESIDVILCLVDLVIFYDPDITDQQINTIMVRKLEKWKRRYKDSVAGDRSVS